MAATDSIELGIHPFINPYRQSPSPEQVAYATDLCETELEFPGGAIDRFPTMSRSEMSRLIRSLRLMRAARLKRSRRAGW